MDVLLVITELNQFGGHSLAAPPNPENAASFFDVNQDHFVSPIDVLLVIDYLNAVPESEAEGESMVAWPVAEVRGPSIPLIYAFAGPTSHDNVGLIAQFEQKCASQVISSPATPLTGSPPSDALNREQLWDDIAAHWTDEDFEELLAQFVSPDDRPTDQWDL